MTEHNNHHHHHHGRDESSDNLPPVELDAASKSLSDALRISFVILKIIMIVLLGLFLVSGFETIGSDEQAIVLRFGKIRGLGENRVLKPRARPYWVFPYPIEEIIKIPVKEMVSLNIRSFWYHQTEDEILAESQDRPKPTRFKNTLVPITDGYCLTRSERQADAPVGVDGTDYNIVHAKWQLRYQIDDPELFFRNVFVRDVKPGDIYSQVMVESITPVLKSLLEDAIVTAMVEFTVDEAIKSHEAIPARVKELLEAKLPRENPGDVQNMCGIRIESVLLTDTIWPRQVNEAFETSIAASQQSQNEITKAGTEARNILTEAAGPVAEQLLEALKQDNSDEKANEQLWAQLAGTAQERIFEARAYRYKVAVDAEANADYFRSLLPEYRKHPEIVVQSIYRDAIEAILSNADEKFIIEPSEGEEIRIHLSRDPSIKPKPKKKETQENSK